MIINFAILGSASENSISGEEESAGWPDNIFAPYVDTTLWSDGGTFDLKNAYDNTGQKYYTLAFITSDAEGNPAWGGYSVYGMDSDHFEDRIDEIRSAGGDVIISFGGANGIELAMAGRNTDVDVLVSKYQKVIDRYDVTWVDFDIEGAAVADTASVARRNDAIKKLEDANPGLTVAYCLPVLPSGLDYNGINVIEDAVDAGVRIDVVNIMAMDYGDYAAPNPSGKMGDYAIEAAENTMSQLAERNIDAKVGITPMIGQNDVSSEIFTIDDAEKLLQWAETEGRIGMISMWSINRDNDGSGGTALYQWTRIDQEDFAFTKIFGSHSGPGDNPVPTPTPTPVTPTPTATPVPTETPTPSAALPGTPVLQHNNWDNDDSYSVTMNMWWGENGDKVELYENDVPAGESSLVMNSPNAQSCTFDFSGKSAGTYRYYAVLSNDAGSTTGGTITVTVEGSSEPTPTPTPVTPTPTATPVPTETPIPSEGLPGTPVLHHNNWDNDDSYSITMNMWWGENGDKVELYENDVPAGEFSLVENSPNAQSCTFDFSGKPVGTYNYYAILSNDAGSTTGGTITVTVEGSLEPTPTPIPTQPPVPAVKIPGTPVLQHNNWDNDGSYSVTMNMWWGENGDEVELYENDAPVGESSLAVNSPYAQSCTFDFSGKAAGKYSYYAVLSNDAGSTESGIVTVTVV